MQTRLNHVHSNHPYLTSCYDVAAIIRPLEKLGITYFNYSRHDRDGGRIYLDSNQSIQESYIANKYYLEGDTEGEPVQYKAGVVHWDTLSNQPLIDKLVRARNVDHGIYLIKPAENYCEFFGFATQKGNPEIINTYLSKCDLLESFSLYFKEQADYLIKRVDAQKLILPFRRDCINLSSNHDFETLVIDFKSSLQTIKLTTRQLEIVHELLKGGSCKTIAKKLKLSCRTVETHINNLKSRLSCNNKSELLIKLSSLDY